MDDERSAAVEAVLEPLDTIDDRELADRLAVFDEMQAGLARVLDGETPPAAAAR